jgi:hypothetical protein
MRPLLCKLHAHTTWSDGELSLRELVDLYGSSGFDVLCVTDHTHPSDDPWVHLGVRPERLPAYYAEVQAEVERARSLYGLLVLPGLELTENASDPDAAAHALALGLRAPVTLEAGIAAAMAAARAAGAVIVAAHPSGPEGTAEGCTRRFWRELDTFRGLVDRWELINGHTAFPWVAEARLPVVANGDFHRREHLATWKTLLPCEHHEDAVLSFLSSSARVHLTVFDPLVSRLTPHAHRRVTHGLVGAS